MGVVDAFVTIAMAYMLVAVVAALWGAHYLATKRRAEWEQDRLDSILFVLYFGITWPAIFIDGLND